MVATVTDIGSASSTVHYFEQDGYYAKGDPEHRKASFWHGTLARELGLGRHVSPKRFNKVLLGYVPGTDIRLGRMRDDEHQHRPGLDITLSALKSVSLAALLHGDKRGIRAHDEAVRAALDRVEAELLQTRGWDPATRRPRVKAHGMAAAFRRNGKQADRRARRRAPPSVDLAPFPPGQVLKRGSRPNGDRKPWNTTGISTPSSSAMKGGG